MLDSLETFQDYFEPRFQALLSYKVNEIKTFTENSKIFLMFSYVQKIAQNGKRFRPFLFHTSYTHHGGHVDIFPYLAGIELLHIFALIHDDIMDKGTMRHGFPTPHIEYTKYYLESPEKEHLSTAQAILLGDLVFAWSAELMATEIENIDKHTLSIMRAHYFTLVKEVTIGQSLDVDFTYSQRQSRQALLEKISLKSGHYSVMHPLLLGVILAEGTTEDVLFCKAYGRLLGLYFQIQDDLLDCTIETSQLGKKRYNDMRQKQQTLITYYVTQLDTNLDLPLFNTYYGKSNLTDTEEKELHQFLADSKVFDYIRQELKTIEQEIQTLIRKNNTSPETVWDTLFQTIKNRTH